jgi:hypothetical protein
MYIIFQLAFSYVPSNQSFPVKRGTACITDDAIQINESLSGYIQSLYTEYWKSDRWWQKCIFAGYVLAFPLGAVGIIGAIRDANTPLIGAVIGIVILLWGLDYARGFRSPDRLPLDAIDSVSFTRGIKGLTRPRIIITYIDGNSTAKRRINLLSLYTTRGETAYQQAQAAFAERGF